MEKNEIFIYWNGPGWYAPDNRGLWKIKEEDQGEPTSEECQEAKVTNHPMLFESEEDVEARNASEWKYYGKLLKIFRN